jgi:hypothetical protein
MAEFWRNSRPYTRMNPEIRNCTVTFQCPKVWSGLKPTADPKVRFCDYCYESVHLVETETELAAASPSRTFPPIIPTILRKVCWERSPRIRPRNRKIVMGYSLSWLAIKGKSPDAVREFLGLRPTGEREEFPESELCAADLPGGWYLVVSDHTPHVAPDTALPALSAGCELVTCFVEEHVMASAATGWKDGRRLWSVIHDAQHGHEHLVAEGDFPPAYSAIRDRLLARQRQEDLGKPPANRRQQRKSGDFSQMRCDYIFNIPVDLAQALTGYTHSKDIPGQTGQPFEVLTGGSPSSVTAPAKKSFFKKLFGG